MVFVPQLYTGGFVRVSEVLSLRRNKDGFKMEDVHRVVANCPKQRFALKEEEGQLLIRANQGHTLQASANCLD